MVARAGGLHVSIDMEPDAIRLSRAMSRIGPFITDLRDPFLQILDDFVAIERRRFAAEGPGWASLSPRYAAWKSRHYPGKSILRRTDALYAEATGGFERNVDRMEMRLRLRTPYAKYHQRGTTRMPKRAVVNITDSDKRRWMKFIQAYGIAAMKRALAAEGVSSSSVA